MSIQPTEEPSIIIKEWRLLLHLQRQRPPPQQSPGAKATPPQNCVSITARLFHIIEPDEIDLAFDNKGCVCVVFPECKNEIPHGKLEADTTYLIKGFKQVGQIITIARYFGSSIFPGDTLKKN